jgi:hypothetical protein
MAPDVFGDFEDAFNAHVTDAGIHAGVGTAATVFVQPTQPSVIANTEYVWIQTGLAPGGTGFTLWFEDGT